MVGREVEKLRELKELSVWILRPLRLFQATVFGREREMEVGRERERERHDHIQARKGNGRGSED